MKASAASADEYGLQRIVDFLTKTVASFSSVVVLSEKDKAKGRKQLNLHKIELFFPLSFSDNITTEEERRVYQFQTRNCNDIHVPFVQKVICRQSILYNGAKI